MLQRTFLLAGTHLLAITGFAYFAGVFSARSGVLQFFGHLAAVIILSGAGLLSISGRIDTPRLIRIEAYLAFGMGCLYVLVDSVIMHPPFGIFDGAGMAEQQHVSLFLMLVGLASLVLATLRYTEALPSIQILIAAVAFAVVFSAHEQHSAISTVAHNASTLFVVMAAVLRLLDRMFEYGVILLIAAHTLFSGQIGLTRFADELGIEPTAWTTYWITAASLAAAAYLAAMRRRPQEIL